MSITESRIKTGTLTFQALDAEGEPTGEAESFACQATNVRITPSFNSSGDPVETMCGDTLGQDETRTDTLNITAIQDFTDPNGFVNYSWDHDGETVRCVWAPRGTAGPSYDGDVKVRAVEVGGDVNKRLTTSAEWPANGKFTRTAATP